jgi:photosystem II stability/assembly factor-like uncharacterized protein
MTTIYLATVGGVSIVKRTGNTWSGSTQLKDQPIECVLVDQRNPNVAYCGTFGSGLYKTTDAGSHWAPCAGLAPRNVSALAMNASGILFAGTEPSEIFRSEDGGATWSALPALTRLPSASKWSFPPRPHTHHVKAILPDCNHPDDLHVAVEAGALVRSYDAGVHWLDRVPSAPRDTHSLVADPLDPCKLFSAAGDGFFQSDDNGGTWRRFEEGLEGTYCWSLAVTSGPSVVQVMSAAKEAYTAHYEQLSNSFVYRREGDSAWQRIRHGLPEAHHHRAAAIAESVSEPGVFYLSTEGLVFRSLDGGRRWKELLVDWVNGIAKHAVNIAAT